MEFRFSQHDTYSEVFARVSAAIGGKATDKTRVRLALESSNDGELIYKAVIEETGNKRSLDRLNLLNRNTSSNTPFHASKKQKPEDRQENWEVFQRLIRNELLNEETTDDVSQLKFMQTIEYITQLVCEQPREVAKGFKYNWLSDLSNVVHSSGVRPEADQLLHNLRHQYTGLNEFDIPQPNLEDLQDDFRRHEAAYEKSLKEGKSIRVPFFGKKDLEVSAPLGPNDFGTAHWAFQGIAYSMMPNSNEAAIAESQSRLNERGEMDIDAPINEEDAPHEAFRHENPEYEVVEKLKRELELEAIFDPLLNRLLELKELSKTREVEADRREALIIKKSAKLRQQIQDFKQQKIWESHVTDSKFNWQIDTKKDL